MVDIGRILLPSLAFALGVITSVYFAIWWWRHRDGAHARSLLFWAIGLFLMFWFQVPAILVGLGKVITVTDFNLFFSLTFPITFLALMLFYLGVLQISEFNLSRKRKILLFSWFALAVAFFAYNFILNKGVVSTYLLPLAGNIAFYLPIRVMIFVVAIKLLFRPEIRTVSGMMGIIGVAGESILGLTRNLFIIDRVLRYPPQFWYMVISDSRFFLVTQTLSIIILAFGFFFLHRAYHRLRYGSNH